MGGTALEVTDLSMTFPGTRALDGVSLEVRTGEIHGLVGHNGSGKSTLIKILAGQHVPDAGGAVRIGGEVLEFGSPSISERLGLRVVHQNLGLVASLSVTENVLIGSGFDLRFGGRIAWRAEHRRAAEQMERLGYRVNPRTPVGELSAATRSAVAIARALTPRRNAPEVTLLLLDEVTATMPELEIVRLLELVGTLRDQGVSVLYVTHHLEEVLEVCDNVTVLRDGRVAGEEAAAGLTIDALADLLVGTSQWRDRAPSDSRPVPEAAVVERNRLTITAMSGQVVRDLSLSTEPGRIVGIAGITGSGREDVAQMIMGAQMRDGEIQIGADRLRPNDPVASVAAGVALVPANRHANGLIPTLNIRENMMLYTLRSKRAFTPMMAKAERPGVWGWIRKLGIRSARPERGIDTLSGGNQQKVILARCMVVTPRVLILDEPTQGVDVGAVLDIHTLIREVASQSAVVVCSSDSFELASLCDEVIVLQRGHVVGRLVGEEITEENLDRLQLSALTPSA